MGLNIELELWNKHNARLEHLSHSKECGHNGLFDCYRIQRRTTFWVWSLVIFFAAAVNIYLEWILQGTWSCPVVPPGFKFVTFSPPFTIAQQWSKCELSTIESPRHGDFELRVMVNTPTNTTEAQHFVLGGYKTRVYHTYVYKYMCIIVYIYIVSRLSPKEGWTKNCNLRDWAFRWNCTFPAQKSRHQAWGTWCCCDSLQVKLVSC